MNRDQAYALVRQTFTQAFDRARYANFAKNLLNRLDESTASSSSNVKDAFRGHVERYERVGTYTSPDDSKVDVLIVHLTKGSKLERARTAIRNFVADHLKTRDEKDAALVAFVSPTEKQWRFSYVKMEYATFESESGKVGVETHLTPARRFSYIVGEGESCHTAQARFLGLLQDTDTNPTLADIESAFSVEAVTREFFAKYAELFEEINTGLTNLIAKDRAIRDDFKAKSVNTVDFAKKLLGQVVFLYFLQKKGWLGVPKGKNWGDGPRDFLRRLAKGEYGPYTNLFNDVLEPLFYDTLATDRGHLAWSSQFQCRIPFLNGGLFEPLADYDWQKTDVFLPNRLFTNTDPIEEGITGSGVLDIFDRYNFTVSEAEPLEKEVAIDPEMLGKVFENLIEENRRKGIGAYYTPREIVHYMCQESLINYLDRTINTRDASLKPIMSKQVNLFGGVAVQAPLRLEEHAEIVPRADIETFVHLGEQISHYEAVETSYRIKMPASIEQHARLIDEKLAAITVCDPAVGSGAFPVGMMTEIVRARSSLTPYFNAIQERTPYQFKRHAIQNCLYGVDIDPGAVEIAKLRLWLSLVVDEEETKQIKPLPNLAFKVVVGNSLIGFPFTSPKLDAIETLKARYFEETDHSQKAALKREIDRSLSDCFASSKRSLGYDVNFDFRVYFSEVFQRTGGFDVVIANPPYDVLNVTEGHKISQEALDQIRGMEVYRNALGGKLNLFRLFIAKGLALLADGACLTFIVPYAFMCDESSKSIRAYVLTTKQLVFIEAFPERDDPRKRLFESAKMSTAIILVRNDPPHHAFRVRTHYSRQISSDVPTISLDLGLVKQFDDVNLSIPLMSDAELSLVRRLTAGGSRKVKDVGRCYQGEINLTIHKRFLRATKGGNARLIKGAAVQRYVIRDSMSQGAIQYLDRTAFDRAFQNPKASHHRLKRIVMQGITGVNERTRLKMAILNEDAYCGHSVKYLLLSDEATGYEYVLAVMNSRLMNWYFKLFSTNSNVNGYEIDNLPIPKPSNGEEETLSGLVRRIEAATARNPKANTQKLEHEIDRLVYSLYGLNSQDISVVEGSAVLADGRDGGAEPA